MDTDQSQKRVLHVHVNEGWGRYRLQVISIDYGNTPD